MPPKRAAAPSKATPLMISYNNVRATKRMRGPPARSPSPPLPFAPPPAPPPLCGARSVLAALAHLRAADPRLAPLIDAHGQRCAERLGGGDGAVAASPPPPPTFPMIARTILAQQLSWKAASTIHRRLLTEAGVLGPRQQQQPQKQQQQKQHGEDGGGSAGAREDEDDEAAATAAAALRLTPGHVLALPEARLRSAGVSGAKAAALRDLAERYSDGRLSDAMLRRASAAAPEGLHAALLAAGRASKQPPPSAPPCPAAEAAAALLAVRGVGPWSLDMVSMFVLRAPDVLPAGDLGVRKGIAKLCGKAMKGRGAAPASALPDAAATERVAAPWRPYRSVGAWLMWRLAEDGG